MVFFFKLKVKRLEQTRVHLLQFNLCGLSSYGVNADNQAAYLRQAHEQKCIQEIGQLKYHHANRRHSGEEQIIILHSEFRTDSNMSACV